MQRNIQDIYFYRTVIQLLEDKQHSDIVWHKEKVLGFSGSITHEQKIYTLECNNPSHGLYV